MNSVIACHIDIGNDKLKQLGNAIIRYYDRPADRPGGYGFQIPYATRIAKEAGIKTMAVGLIVDPRQANAIVVTGQAELVAIGREALSDPNFAYHAERVISAHDPASPFGNWPKPIGWWLNVRQRKLNSLGAWLPEKPDVN